MKSRFYGLLILILISSSIISVSADYVFSSESYLDELGDTVDFNACFYGETIVPMPLEIDAFTVTFSSAELTGGEDTNLIITSKISEQTPQSMSYTWEYVFDVDSDISTGASSPACFYNGLGADYDVGVEVLMGTVASSWIDAYEDGKWLRVGQPEVDFEGGSMTIILPLSTFPFPLDASVMVYLIGSGGLDMMPNLGEPPIKIDYHHIPEALIEVPELVYEGAPVELDSSPSFSLNGPITRFDWDLDGDGVYDESLTEPSMQTSFPDNGEYSVTLTIFDTYGFSGTNTVIFNVENEPPKNPEITQTGELKIDETLTFTGSAEDVGDDELTYIWDFGDGETSEGVEVNHSYDAAGEYVVTLRVLDDDGGEVIETKDIEVAPTETETPDGGGPPIDPLLLALLILFGFGGWLIYDYFFGEGKNGKKKKKKKEKDFCEEHPEVVEEENKKCEEALEALDDALGPIEENLENYKQTWQDISREVGRLIGEFDVAYAVVASLTESEAQLYEDGSKVQEIAGKVTGFAGSIKTVAKEGAEEAVKDFAKDMAKDRAKEAAGDMSSFVSDILGLEEWAMNEIGIGIAKLVTGVDPQKEASAIREASLEIVNALETWISRPHAYNAGVQPPRILQDYIDDMQNLLDAIDKALQDFEAAVAGFRCVTCEIGEPYSEHIRNMINEIGDWMRAFGDMIDQVEQRLEQAIALYGLKDAYEDPYSRVNFQNRQIPDIKRALQNSAESKK